jgi:hypothetical protein
VQIDLVGAAACGLLISYSMHRKENQVPPRAAEIGPASAADGVRSPLNQIGGQTLKV